MDIRKMRVLITRQLTAVGVLLIMSSCNLFAPGHFYIENAPEIELDVVWQIAAVFPEGGVNALFNGEYMHFILNPINKVLTINLDNKEIINYIPTESITNPIKNGDYIFITNDWYIEGYPVFYFCDLEGNSIGKIPLQEKYNGWAFSIFSHSHYIYWSTFFNGKQSFVRLDTSTIQSIGGDEYTADVQVLCPPENNYACGANPSFYDGKVYLPVDDINYNDVTRLLVFDETSGNLLQNIPFSEMIGANHNVEIFLSGDIGLVNHKKVNIKTGEVFPETIRVSTHFAPYTFQDSYGYASSDAHGGTDYTSLWKLNMETLEVEWYYQHEYSLGTQPQVVDGIVYVTAPDMILLFDADTGKILAKDTDLKGHPIQHANSYLYGDLMIFHDGYNITAIRTNWKKTLFGVEKTE